jgi:beta-glucanase (GH16 family)
VEVGGGTLTLWSRADASVPGFNFSSAAVTSKDKRRWTWVDGAYRVCVSAVLPGYAPPSSGLTGQGYWPAHWLMPNDSSCDPDEGEFDMMEMISGNGRLYSTYHWQDNWPAKPCSFPQGHQEVTANMSLPATWGTDFHEYAVEVSGTHVAFAFDGQTLLNRTTAAGPVPQPLLWPVPFYVFLNTAIGAPHNWPGAPNATTIFPSAHVIDYVRVIQQQKQR